MRYLRDRDWTLSAQILGDLGRASTDTHTRWIRALAKASEGRIAGGQKGYKLVMNMTLDEYQHWRNWMKSQADEMTARILEADKVWYSRQPVRSGNGILTANNPRTGKGMEAKE